MDLQEKLRGTVHPRIRILALEQGVAGVKLGGGRIKTQ